MCGNIYSALLSQRNHQFLLLKFIIHIRCCYQSMNIIVRNTRVRKKERKTTTRLLQLTRLQHHQQQQQQQQKLVNF